MDQSTHDIRLAKWLPIVQECVSSGMSKTEWCEANGVNIKKLYYWQRKARAALAPQVTLVTNTSKSLDKPTTFAPVPSSAMKSYDTCTSFTPDVILKANGIAIEIANTASLELLSRIGGIFNVK